MNDTAASREAPLVSIVSVNYKVPDLVGHLIESVPAAAQGLPFEIIIVDNDSGDDSVPTLRRAYPDVNVIASKVNLGFSRGNNLGAEQARGEFLALVNPDVVLPAGSLARLVDFLRAHPTAGLVGPRVELPDGSTQSSPARLPSAWDIVRALPGMSRAENALQRARSGNGAQEPVACGAVHGSCMFFRASAFRAVGGMPSNTFMYGEEPIMGHRMHEGGFDVWYNPLIHILHQDEACADKRWVPHEKALRKRNGHIVAHAEILPRPLSVAWNAIMAARELSRSARSLFDKRSSTQHLDFARLHLSGMTRAKGDTAHPLLD